MDRREISRTLTAIESGEQIEIKSRQRTSEWAVLGITGPPGVGKSCVVDHLVRSWINRGEKVAILAIDPSSPVSGGALLGDRMRMSSVDEGEGVFLRSIATRNLPGGLPARLEKMIDFLIQEGWNRIIIETVGSGQSEVRIVAVADRLLLIEGPDRGDVIQAEKAGIMELADIIAVNKADLSGAEQAAADIRLALEMADSEPAPVLICSAETGQGVSELIAALDQLQSARGPAIARARERLIAYHQELLLSHPDFSDVLKGLSAGQLTIEEAMKALQ